MPLLPRLVRRLLLLALAFFGFIFLAVGVSFLFFADDESVGSRLNKTLDTLLSPRLEQTKHAPKPLPAAFGYERLILSFERESGLKFLTTKGGSDVSLVFDPQRKGGLLRIADFGGERVTLVVTLDEPLTITEERSLKVRMWGEGLAGFGLKLWSAEGGRLYSAIIPGYQEHAGWQSYTIAIPTFTAWSYNDAAHVFVKDSLWRSPGEVHKIEMVFGPQKGSADFLLGSLSLR